MNPLDICVSVEKIAKIDALKETEAVKEKQSGFLLSSSPQQLPKTISYAHLSDQTAKHIMPLTLSPENVNQARFSNNKLDIAKKIESHQTIITEKIQTTQLLGKRLQSFSSLHKPSTSLNLLTNQLKEILKKEIVEKDLVGLNGVTYHVNELLKCYLNEILNEFFLVDKKNLKDTNAVDHDLKEIIKSLLNIHPLTEDTLKLKERLLIEFNQYTKIVEQAIKSAHFNNPFDEKKDHHFYLAYSEFVKAKNEWRGSIFNTRLNWLESLKNPSAHPEWPIFLKEMKKYIKDESKINEIWKLTIEGIDYQINLNKIGKKNDLNPKFKQLAFTLNKEGLLSPAISQPIALWSGGFDVSLYAQSQGLTTLEKTKAGEIFSTLMLFSTWEPLGPLWNHLSQEFAKNPTEIVHVFFRTHDPLSVLERQELKEISASKHVKTIVFHPIINRGKAIDFLDVEELSVDVKDNPAITLKNTLVRISQKALKKEVEDLYKANLYAIRKMKLD